MADVLRMSLIESAISTVSKRINKTSRNAATSSNAVVHCTDDGGAAEYTTTTVADEYLQSGGDHQYHTQEEKNQEQQSFLNMDSEYTRKAQTIASMDAATTVEHQFSHESSDKGVAAASTGKNDETKDNRIRGKRRAIDIESISDTRQKKTAFGKRKLGLFNKAFQLKHLLADECEIFLVVATSSKDVLHNTFIFASGRWKSMVDMNEPLFETLLNTIKSSVEFRDSQADQMQESHQQQQQQQQMEQKALALLLNATSETARKYSYKYHTHDHAKSAKNYWWITTNARANGSRAASRKSGNNNNEKNSVSANENNHQPKNSAMNVAASSNSIATYSNDVLLINDSSNSSSSMSAHGSNEEPQQQQQQQPFPSVLKQAAKRRAIPLVKIEDKRARSACRSKRTKGLMKKLFELLTLTDAIGGFMIANHEGKYSFYCSHELISWFSDCSVLERFAQMQQQPDYPLYYPLEANATALNAVVPKKYQLTKKIQSVELNDSRKLIDSNSTVKDSFVKMYIDDQVLSLLKNGNINTATVSIPAPPSPPPQTPGDSVYDEQTPSRPLLCTSVGAKAVAPKKPVSDDFAANCTFEFSYTPAVSLQQQSHPGNDSNTWLTAIKDELEAQIANDALEASFTPDADIPVQQEQVNNLEDVAVEAPVIKAAPQIVLVEQEASNNSTKKHQQQQQTRRKRDIFEDSGRPSAPKLLPSVNVKKEVYYM